jgi:hypothetical protein
MKNLVKIDDKEWVNDGGSAGYPDYMDSQEFYRSLYKGILEVI